MKNNKLNQDKYPQVGIHDEEQVSDSKIDLWIDCGNLYLRENVSLWDDIDFAVKNLRRLIDEYNKKYTGKISSFFFDMSYSIPNPKEIKLLDEKKFEEYEKIDGTNHWFDLLDYKSEQNTLYVSTDIFASDYKIIADVANLIGGLKEISFYIGMPQGKYLFELDGEDDVYIRNKLNNENWSRWFLYCEKRYTKHGEYGNDLDIIKELRSLIDKDINLDFEVFRDQIPFIKKEGLIK